MRKLRKLSMAVVLTLACATYGFAGIIGTGPEPPPEPGTIETPPNSSSLVATIVVDLIQIAVRR